MSLRDRLNIANVTVSRVTKTIDSYGDPVTTTLTTMIPKASIWSPTQNDKRISDKIAKTSTHILAIEYGAYTFTTDDKTVTSGGVAYRLVGHEDNVANRNMLVLHGMERIT